MPGKNTRMKVGGNGGENPLSGTYISAMTENQWKAVILACSCAVVILTLYCLSQGITIIFTHTYYVPVVLLAYHYRRRGLIGIVLLCLIYIVIACMFGWGDPTTLPGVLIRSVVFLGIGALVVYFSEHLLRTRELLKENLQIQRSIIQNSNVWLMVLDSQGRILEWNAAAEEMSGYPAREVIGKNEIWKNLYPEKRHRKEITERISEIIQKDEYFANLKTVITCRDGSLKTMLWNTRKIPGEERDPERFIAIGTDITDLSRVEEELRSSEERFRTLFENMLNGFAYCEMLYSDGRPDDFLYISVNKAFERLTGLKDIVGKRVTEAIPGIKEETPELFGIYARVAEPRTPEQFEIDFTPLSMQLFISVYSPQKGFFVAIFEDITERKKADRAIRESEARFKNLFEKMNAGVAIYEASENGEDFIFKEINPAVEKIENVRREHVVGHSICEIFPGVKEFGLFDAILRVWKTGEAETHPVSVYRDNRIAGWRENTIYKLPSGEIVAIYEDITEKKKAEEALAASEEKFRGVAERSFDLILLTDKSSLLTYVSPSVTGMLGYSPEEVMGKSAFEFVHPESLRDVQEGFLKNLEGFITGPLEVSVRKKEGGYAILEIQGAAITKDGVFDGMQVIGRDITSKKADQERIAELLKIQQEQVRIINTSPAVSFLWRAEENWPVEMVSKNINQFGYTPDDFLSGRIPYFSIVHPDDTHRVGEEVKYNGIRGIDEFSQQYRILGKEGRAYWIDDFTHIRRDTEGKITHYEGIVLDITERKLAEEALRESERRNALLLDAIPDMMFIISRDGVYRDFNAPEESDLLIPPEELVGKTIWDTPGFSRELADSIMSHITHTFSTRHLQHFVYDLDFPGGKRHYEARTVALDEGEALAIVRDITEQKQAEELQKHFTEKLEQEVLSRTAALNASLQEKVVLLREVHHRVKNNLQIIISLTNLQMRRIDDIHLKQALAETQNRVKAMSLVHEKLYQSEDLSMVNFSAYIQSLVSQLFTYYGVNSRKIVLHIDIGTIMIDINTAIPLGLVINELVSNVVKHAFPGERSGEVFITAKEENNRMAITIRDTGIGFPEGFDWRHTNSLGLHLVSALIEQVQGSIDMVNNGPGTTFRMVIPSSAERA